MNWLDWAVVVGLAGFALRGFFKGLVVESLGFLGLLLAAAASLYANPTAADLLHRPLGASRPLAAVAAAILVFLVAEFVWLLCIYSLLGRGRHEGFRKSGANRLGGVLLGMGKGVLLVSLGLLLLEAAPMLPAYRAAAEGGALAGRVRAVAPWIEVRVAAILPESARERYVTFRGHVTELRARWGQSPAAPDGSPAKARK